MAGKFNVALARIRWRSVLPIALLAIIADQLSKLAVLASLQPGQVSPVIPGFFELTLALNRGAAFGFLANMPDGLRQILLALATLVAMAAVGYFLIHEHYSGHLAQVSLALIIGGAVGNIIDRVRLGDVIDFLDFYFNDFHYPAFNVADSCICVGVVLLFVRGGKR